MIYLVSILSVLAVMGGAAAVILVTLRDHADSVVAALAGRSIRAEAMIAPAPRIRVTVRTPGRRRWSCLPLRAAA